MRTYVVIIERGPHNYSAYVPDLPGCITTGKTIEEIKANIREAIELHLEGLVEDGGLFQNLVWWRLRLNCPFNRVRLDLLGPRSRYQWVGHFDSHNH